MTAADVRQADTAEAAAARFGMPPAWGRYHTAGMHVCVDGRHYSGRGGGCLVTDPTCEWIARDCLAGAA
jgi:hypothetical protein